jgi:hypothetical protein
MYLNDLLQDGEIEPTTLMVLRHRPTEAPLRAALPFLAAEKHSVFNAYQQTQGPKVEKAMKKAKVIASFIGHEPSKALFVGFYRLAGWKPLSYRQYWKIPENRELHQLGMQGMQPDKAVTLWFELQPMEYLSQWKGKLIIDWPGKEVSWWRWAGNKTNKFQIHAILEESRLVETIADWRKLTLSWQQLTMLPTQWRAELSRWAGVYYIFDTSDRSGYVGAAYGEENFLGRWKHYARSGHGGNKKLRTRKPENFLFSILELVPPSKEAEIQALEQDWKDRLHTRTHGLNDN